MPVVTGPGDPERQPGQHLLSEVAELVAVKRGDDPRVAERNPAAVRLQRSDHTFQTKEPSTVVERRPGRRNPTAVWLATPTEFGHTAGSPKIRWAHIDPLNLLVRGPM